MTRFALMPAVATATLLTLAGCSAAGGAAPAGAPTATAESAAASTTASAPASPDQGTIVTTGTGTVRATPDVLTVVLGVETAAASATAALDQNNALATDVIAVLKENGVAADDLQTSRLSVNPTYDDKARITGYQVTNTVTATLRDVSAAGAVIDAAARKAGDAVRVQQVGFSIGDDNDQRAAARAAAVTQARAQAEQLASAAGVHLGPLVSLTESSPNAPIEYFAAGASMDAGVPLEAGSQDVQVVVQAVYAVAG